MKAEVGVFVRFSSELGVQLRRSVSRNRGCNSGIEVIWFELFRIVEMAIKPPGVVRGVCFAQIVGLLYLVVSLDAPFHYPACHIIHVALGSHTGVQTGETSSVY
jgi:hypothetical protein